MLRRRARLVLPNCLHHVIQRGHNRQAEKYAPWLRETIPESEIKLRREATQRRQLTAKERFVREIAVKINHRLELREPGRAAEKS